MSIIEKALDKQNQSNEARSPEPAATGIPEAFEAPLSPEVKEKKQESRPPRKSHIKLPIERLKENGMLVPNSANGQLAEEYRVIKRPLLMNAFGEGNEVIQNANLILVTSSLPGEGKTFNAVNLALSIAAERDRTVLLVDADVIKPAASRLFGVEDRPGLIDLLEREKTFPEVLLRTDEPKLAIIPAGRRHLHATELLASEGMKQLARGMSRKYPDRIIIFDSPPLLATTQAGVLANHVGQVVLVVESESTPQYIVGEAVRILSDCDVVGCVLNKTKQGFGLGYYAYYGYKYYYQNDNDNI